MFGKTVPYSFLVLHCDYSFSQSKSTFMVVPCTHYSLLSIAPIVCLDLFVFPVFLFRSSTSNKCTKTTEALDPVTGETTTTTVEIMSTCPDGLNLHPNQPLCMSCPEDFTYEYVQLNIVYDCNITSGSIRTV